MAAGTGIGVGTGAGLGTLSGALVGGTTSLITGGLGGAIGTGVGALSGPLVNMGDVAGKGIQSVTGNLPEWKPTDEQKAQFEKMVGQVKDTKRPGADELAALVKGRGDNGGSVQKDGAHGKAQAEDKGEKAKEGEDAKGSWTESAASYLPSMSS